MAELVVYASSNRLLRPLSGYVCVAPGSEWTVIGV